MMSLQNRLNISLGLSLVLVFVLIGALLNTVIDQLTESLIVSRLQHDGESIISALDFNPQGRALLGTEKLSAIYQRAYSGHYYSIEFAAGEKLHSRSLWDQNLSSQTLAMGEQGHWQSTGPAGQPLLIWSGRFNKQGVDFTLLVAEDLTPIQQSLNRFTAWFAALTIAFLILLLLTQRIIVRRGFKPIKQLSREIQYLEQGELKLLSTQVPSELHPLVQEVNHLITLLRRQLERYRASTGNLAHALKTPLSLLQQMADHEHLDAAPQLAQDLKHQTQTIHHLIDRELTRARLAGSASPGQRFEPAKELATLREVLLRIYQDKGLSLEFSYPETGSLPVERDDMLELLGNLLDNACKWARHRVQLHITADHVLSINVEDDGPGCEQEKLAMLTTPGLRLDESKSGHGLGLGIVTDIVSSYQGSIELRRSKNLGGLRVTICLPENIQPQP